MQVSLNRTKRQTLPQMRENSSCMTALEPRFTLFPNFGLNRNISSSSGSQAFGHWLEGNRHKLSGSPSSACFLTLQLFEHVCLHNHVSEFLFNCACVPARSAVSDSATTWTVARHASLSMELSRKEYRSGFAISFSRGSSQWLNPYLLCFQHCRWIFTTEPSGKPQFLIIHLFIYFTHTHTHTHTQTHTHTLLVLFLMHLPSPFNGVSLFSSRKQFLKSCPRREAYQE